MPSSWRQSNGVQRGVYASVAQNDDANANADSTTHQEHSEQPLHSMSEDNMWNSSDTHAFGDEPTQEEYATLPKVSGKLPWGAFLVAIVELCERFAYYGLAGPFQNYIANKYHDPNGLPGAIGFGQSRATALSNFFMFWCYLTPIMGAIVADQYLGKYTTIKYFSVVYMIGILVLFVTSMPISIENGAAFPGLAAAMIIIGLGTGGIKPNVAPLIADQVRSTAPYVKVLSSGKKVIVDPDVTVQRIYMVFYMSINIGSVSAMVTTLLELHVGFWSAYLLPFVMFCVGFFILVSNRKRYIVRPPQGGVIGNCFKALWIAARNRFDLDKAKPSFQAQGKKSYNISWDDKFIDELRTGLMACKAFLFLPIYWLTYSQMLNNFVSQAGQMELHGLPNDILPNINPITLITLIPILDRLVYPFMRTKLNIAFTPYTRITWGFLLASLAMGYAAILQSRIYSAPPCFASPSNCPAGKISEGKYQPNQISVAWQTPAYILIASSEILASITGLELAYSKAPKNMKSFIMSLFLLTNAMGSALGMLLAPFAKDPKLVWLYTGLACTALLAGVAFHWTFRNVDNSVPKPVESAEEEIEVAVRKSDDDERETAVV